jgi:hypothetical protein
MRHHRRIEPARAMRSLELQVARLENALSALQWL